VVVLLVELRLAACCVHSPLHGPTLTWLLVVHSLPWLGLVGLKLSLSLIDAGCSASESRASSRQTRPHCGPPTSPASQQAQLPSFHHQKAALCLLAPFGLVRFIHRTCPFSLRHGSLPLTFTLHPPPPPFFSSPYPRDTHPISIRGKEDHPDN
jgi:hypothetical protein